jgi:hypothetical protein
MPDNLSHGAVTTVADLLQAAGPVALVHGDLHPGHMLLGDDARLIGILDWTEARITDPSVDLAMYFGCFGRPALETLIERFARAGGTTWPGLAGHAAERWAIFPVIAAHKRLLISGSSPYPGHGLMLPQLPWARRNARECTRSCRWHEKDQVVHAGVQCRAVGLVQYQGCWLRR